MSEYNQPQEMSGEASQTSGMSVPTENPPDEAVQADGDGDGDGQSSPSELPPDEVAAGDEAFGAGVWQKNKKITALWSKAENRNSWIGVGGLGWRKLANNSDSAVIALTMLGAYAKQANRNVNLREEKKRIKEMYVW